MGARGGGGGHEGGRVEGWKGEEGRKGGGAGARVEGRGEGGFITMGL